MSGIFHRIPWLAVAPLIAALIAVASAQDNNTDEQMGADSPEAAAKGTLEALKNKDLQALKKLVPESDREGMDEEGQMLVDAITVESYEILSTEIEETEGYVFYRWSAKIDRDKILESALQSRRKEMEEAGIDKESIEQELDGMRNFMRAMLDRLIDHFAQEHHRMTVEQIDGRWYVSQPWEDPGEMAVPLTGGGDTPSETVQKALDALKAGKTDDFVNLLAPEFRRYFTMAEENLLPALKVESYEIGETSEADGSAEVRVEWQAKLDTDAYTKGQVDRQIDSMKAMGMDADQLEQMRQMMEQNIRMAADELNTTIAESPQTISLTQINGKWYIDGFLGIDFGGGGFDEFPEEMPEDDGGRETPEGAANDYLAALAENNGEALDELTSPDMRFDSEFANVRDALTVESFEIGDVKTAGDVGIAKFTWKATFDAETFAEAQVANTEEMLRQFGQEGEELQAALEATRKMAAFVAAELKAKFEAESQIMALVKHGENWYVADVTGGDDDMVLPGAASPEDALQGFMGAMQMQNLDGMRRFIPENEMDEFAEEAAPILLALAVYGWSTESLEVDEEDDSRATAIVTWSAELDTDAAAENVRAMLYEELAAEGLAGDELDQAVESKMEFVGRELASIGEILAQSRQKVTMERHDGRWYIHRIKPADNKDGASESKPEERTPDDGNN